jgi:hypothetical protein
MNHEQFMASLADAEPHVRNRWLCIQAFHNRDYQRCAELARHSLETVTSPVEMRLLLVALQRLGRQEEADAIAPRLLEAVRDMPWEGTLLRLILGDMAVEQVIAAAGDGVQQWEARFYAAIRLLRENQVEAARSQFLAIMALDPPECYEFLMAASEYRALSPPPTRHQSPTSDQPQRVGIREVAGLLLVFLLFTLAGPGMLWSSYSTYQDLREWERTGGVRKMRWIEALLFDWFGPLGVAIPGWLVGAGVTALEAVCGVFLLACLIRAAFRRKVRGAGPVSGVRDTHEQGTDAQPAAWHCTYCGWRSETPLDEHACNKCGKLAPRGGECPTMVTCGACRQANLAIASFCGRCGAQLRTGEA